MDFDAPAVFVHAIDSGDPPTEADFAQPPIPYSGTFYNVHQELIMTCWALTVDTENRLWAASDHDPITWFEISGLRHE